MGFAVGVRPDRHVAPHVSQSATSCRRTWPCGVVHVGVIKPSSLYRPSSPRDTPTRLDASEVVTNGSNGKSCGIPQSCLIHRSGTLCHRPAVIV